MSKITLRVIPNASKSEVVAKEDGGWKIRLAAPPVDGKANEALVDFLAEVLDMAPSLIEIVKGYAGKTKVVEVPMHEEDVDFAFTMKARGE